MVSKINIVPDVENGSTPSAAFDVESEITTELASLESGCESEVPHGAKFEEEDSGAYGGKCEITTQLASLQSGCESELPHGAKLQEENCDGASDGNGETVGKTEGTTLNMESNIDLAVEEVRAQVEASQTNNESEITAQSTSIGHCSNVEVPPSL
ncbi:hypothetical protein DITRI_Ditri01bG0093200 [Diplodiscus trichospermus]